MMNKRTFFLLVFSLGIGKSMVAQNLPQMGKATVDELISTLTLDEKVSLLVGAGDDEVAGPNDSIATAIVGNIRKIVPGAAGVTHAIPRLGIPPIVLADGPAGLRIDSHRKGTDSTFYCTHFPVATLLASTWNTGLIEAVGDAMGNEAHEYGIDILLAPATNIMRNPLCGRNFEYYSEDPVLSGKTAAAMIRGIQKNGVGTSLKHFALNNQEMNRTRNNVQVSPRVMHEIYLKPFEIAVREAKPWTLMSAYNQINGIYASENPLLLDTILRRQWGFQGVVMTDWLGGVEPVKQMYAGNDLLMPGFNKQQETIKVGIRNKILRTTVLDQNVRNVLELITKTPRFKQYPYSNAPDLKNHIQISREAATEGMVLLSNRQNTLPLDSSLVHRVAAFGITSYDFIAGGGGSGDVNRAYTVSLIDGLKNAGMKPDTALIQLYQNYIDNQSAKLPPFVFGNPVQRIAEMDIPDSIIQQQATLQDVAIITLGRISGEFADRSVKDDFCLTDIEQSLIHRVCTAFQAQKKRVIVVLNTCGVIETVSWKDQPDAILVSWLAGQEGGNAVVDILTGKSNPSGKLTMTWPIHYEDVPSSANFPVKGSTANLDSTRYEEGLFVGYRYFDTFNKPVSYPFGYGLSYTHFDYKNLNITKTEDEIQLSCLITNSGDKAGKEIVQIYVAVPGNGKEYPFKALKAFGKTQLLQPGETENVTCSIPKSYLCQYDEASGCWKQPKGIYRFFVNSAVDKCWLEGTIRQ